MAQEFYKSGKLVGAIDFDVEPVSLYQKELSYKPRSGWFYWRKEGMNWEPGLGLMWEHKSRGFLLMVGKVYLWVRYSGRAKRLFVRAGILRHGEVTE